MSDYTWAAFDQGHPYRPPVVQWSERSRVWGVYMWKDRRGLVWQSIIEQIGEWHLSPGEVAALRNPAARKSAEALGFRCCRAHDISERKILRMTAGNRSDDDAKCPWPGVSDAKMACVINAADALERGDVGRAASHLDAYLWALGDFKTMCHRRTVERVYAELIGLVSGEIKGTRKRRSRKRPATDEAA